MPFSDERKGLSSSMRCLFPQAAFHKVAICISRQVEEGKGEGSGPIGPIGSVGSVGSVGSIAKYGIKTCEKWMREGGWGAGVRGCGASCSELAIHRGEAGAVYRRFPSASNAISAGGPATWVRGLRRA